MQAPDRFRDNFNALEKRALPFVSDDSITFRVVLSNLNQTAGSTSGWSVPNQIRDRVFKIRMVLKATPANLSVDGLVPLFTV
jgi:hypothetical protein